MTSSSPHPRRPILPLLSATLLGLLLALPLLVTHPSVLSVPSVHAASKEQKASGATLFHEKGCEHCHGVDGIGGERGPDLSTVGKRWRKPQIEKQIREGGNGMPPFGELLQPTEFNDLVAYVSAKKKAPRGQPQPPAPAPPATHTED